METVNYFTSSLLLLFLDIFFIVRSTAGSDQRLSTVTHVCRRFPFVDTLNKSGIFKFIVHIKKIELVRVTVQKSEAATTAAEPFKLHRQNSYKRKTITQSETMSFTVFP